jgi:hypothetical protein
MALPDRAEAGRPPRAADLLRAALGVAAVAAAVLAILDLRGEAHQTRGALATP